jgi:uncharacterized protein HemX
MKLDGKWIAIIVLSVALAISLGVFTYVKKNDSNTITTLNALSVQLRTDNLTLIGRLDDNTKQVDGLKSSNTQLNNLLDRSAAENKRLNGIISSVRSENQRINGQLNDLSGLVSSIASGTGSAETTIDSIIELFGKLESIVNK